MLKQSLTLSIVLLLAFVCVSTPVHAAESGGSDAVVTVIQGTARVYSREATKGRGIKKGDRIKEDQEVRVAKKSRIEMRFPDGTVMRLAEKSRLKMNDLAFNKKTESKNVEVDLAVGKLWATVKKLGTPDSSVVVKTSNAVAGVRGTVYQVNVFEDKSAKVKVYDGEVFVANPPRDAAQPTDKVTAPHPVAGPHAVPPPMHEVSMEEWTVIVKAMQQISISPQGVASKPQVIDPQADTDAWVKWNQERDKELTF
ncbi:MAG: FecR family protein [Nitrospirae bacterium]|nr:FecR family protein [Nitrospirota bacterium]